MFLCEEYINPTVPYTYYAPGVLPVQQFGIGHALYIIRTPYIQ